MKKPRLFSDCFLAAIILTAVVTPVMPRVAVPMLMNYQGELRSPETGEPLPDGSYDMVFRIFDVQSGGDPLWEGRYSAANRNPVEVAGGVFNVILGSGAGNEADASVFGAPERWLEIQIGREILSPRQRMTSVPYAVASQTTGMFPRPAYDSGWLSISQGLTITLTHNLRGNPDDYVVDLQFLHQSAFGRHQIGYGGRTTWFWASGEDLNQGGVWYGLTDTEIKVMRDSDDPFIDKIRARIWVCQ